MTEIVDSLLGVPYPTVWRIPWNVTSSTVVTPPSVEPIDLATAKLHLRVTDTAQDALIAILITAARTHVENVCQRALINQTWRVTYDRFVQPLQLPGGNVQSITALTYIDVNGASQTLAPTTGYVADLASFPARIFPPMSQCWPEAGAIPASVSCVYTLGYGATSASIPAPLVGAMLLIIGDLYENRESHVPTRYFVANDTVDMLLFPYKRVEP